MRSSQVIGWQRAHGSMSPIYLQKGLPSKNQVEGGIVLPPGLLDLAFGRPNVTPTVRTGEDATGIREDGVVGMCRWPPWHGPTVPSHRDCQTSTSMQQGCHVLCVSVQVRASENRRTGREGLPDRSPLPRQPCCRPRSVAIATGEPKRNTGLREARDLSETILDGRAAARGPTGWCCPVVGTGRGGRGAGGWCMWLWRGRGFLVLWPWKLVQPQHDSDSARVMMLAGRYSPGSEAQQRCCCGATPVCHGR